MSMSPADEKLWRTIVRLIRGLASGLDEWVAAKTGKTEESK